MKVNIGPFPGAKSKKDRVVKIKVEKFDSWNADQTMAMLCTPILKQLLATKHGAGWIDDEDVPEKIRSTSAPPKKNEFDTDKFHFKRYDWVLKEMIWALNQIAEGYPGEDKFHHGTPKYLEKKLENGNVEWTKSPKCTYRLDRPGYDAYHNRIKNGTRLFGKYFQTLWD